MAPARRLARIFLPSGSFGQGNAMIRPTPGHQRCFRPLLFIPLFVLLAAVVAAGCGNASTAGPLGTPESIVTRAPDVTLSAGTASIRINSPAAQAQGVVDFTNRTGHLTVLDPNLTKPEDLLIADGLGYIRRSTDSAYSLIGGGAAVPPAIAGGDPFANLDLIRGTVHILSDGGAEVDGASTIYYTLTIDPAQAIETTPPARQASLRTILEGRTADFPIDVYIDSKFFVRRIEVPTDLKPLTPATRDDRMTIATDVDYLAFGVPTAPVVPPPTISGGG
jgi:hypothetical protein